MADRTPLHDEHVALDARLVDFAGWDMPIDYGSQIAEHKAVRDNAGMFDVSHMAVADITGDDAREFLRRVMANDVARIDEVGRALYTCMLNTRGGVIDDLIVYHLAEGHYRAVLNAATTNKDLAWLHGQIGTYRVAVEHRSDLAIVAVQGPRARELTTKVLDTGLAEAAFRLKPFSATTEGDVSVGRTGYTGEDGFEIVMPAGDAAAFWRALKSTGVAPVGLGARDTLRLEAGLNLYGQDMDEDTTPLESGLAWTVAFEPAEREFVGREALEHARAAGVTMQRVGLVLEGRGVMRHGAKVRAAGSNVAAADAAGEVTSGSYAPTLSRSIGLARIPSDWDDGVEVAIRDKWLPARLVTPPFVRNGKSRIDDA
ncbi:glycine cleavage system aminomethyltransferase GcvT [Salinisphaera orenii]|uniref:Aminomethyltransferase n=1 Tax=Salinisphaera orenii YIM 95161 TaxID=1051139 RepID=A0A423PJV2_9GAMM|nr:glycine cleavage system aminomethyltransferase GcvT [Salinisphaera halophila]ROO25878.1 glycine cleavage system aminomethyltransferase T [Salinisphaera halophila YIM 95161]